MSVSFTFALSQEQTFELRCDYGSRCLDKVELLALIDQCEQLLLKLPSCSKNTYLTNREDTLVHEGRRKRR